MPLVTVADVVATVVAPLTSGHRLLAGRPGLDREVTWAVMARPSSPIFPTVKAGELALASAPALQQLDPPASLALLIEGLAERHASGLILRGPLGAGERAAASAAADRLGIPLLLAAADVPLPDVERAVTSLVRERRDEFYRRTAQLQEVQFQLAEALPGAGGLQAVVRVLADLAGVPAALTGPPPGLDLRAVSAGRDGAPPVAALRAAWGTLAARALTTWQTPGRLDGARAAEPPVLLLDAPGGALLAAPVLVRERLAAALVLLVPTPAGAMDQLTLARAAGVCALDLARARAVAVAETRTEQRLSGELIAELLHARPGTSEDVLLGRARALGLEIAPGYAVALLSLARPQDDPAPSDDTDAARLEPAVRLLSAATREHGGHVQLLGPRLALLWPLPARAVTGGPVAPPAALARIVEEARASLGRAGAGLGRAYPGLGGVARSRQEAEQGLWAAWHLFAGDRTCRYSDLGIYRLLLPLRTDHAAEMRAYYEETLGALGDGAGRNGQQAKLLETLEAFLDHGGNHSETAAALFLHRNTLSYRLRRLGDITGLDLDDPAVRFRTQVALCVRRLIGA